LSYHLALLPPLHRTPPNTQIAFLLDWDPGQIEDWYRDPYSPHFNYFKLPWFYCASSPLLSLTTIKLASFTLYRSLRIRNPSSTHLPPTMSSESITIPSGLSNPSTPYSSNEKSPSGSSSSSPYYRSPQTPSPASKSQGRKATHNRRPSLLSMHAPSA